MYVISDHTSSLYLFLIPPCPCWGIRTSRRPGAPAAPPRCAPWRTCGADRSSRASSHTPPARSRSGRRHLQQTNGTRVGHPGTSLLLCALHFGCLKSWFLAQELKCLCYQHSTAEPKVWTSFEQAAVRKMVKLKYRPSSGLTPVRVRKAAQ